MHTISHYLKFRTMPVGLAFSIFTVCLASACGPKPVAPRQRYITALNQRLEGNSQAYYDGIIALAHDEPDSRAGRRARATLSSGTGVMTMVAVGGVLAAVAIPNFQKFSARSKAAEAKSTLHLVYSLQEAYRAENGRYCPSFKECAFAPEPSARYFYMLSEQDVVGGDAAPDAQHVRMIADAVMASMKLVPHSGRDEFLAVAVSNLDSDDGLDIWTIDEDRNLVHVIDDVD